MMPYFTERWYNPSSLYSNARAVNKDIANAKQTIGKFVNAQEDEIYFTSGGSESNCWAIMGFVNNCRAKNITPVIITTPIEHKSLIECVKASGAKFYYVVVDTEGFIDESSLDALLDIANEHYAKCRILVSIQFANNEIGTIQRIRALSGIAHKHGAVFHTDAVQSFGQIDIDVGKLGIDMMSVSGHKIHAPKGIGFLYIKEGVEISPLIYGSQMRGMRGGTENVPYIVGLAKAVSLCDISSLKQKNRKRVRDYFIGKLLEISCVLNGTTGESRLANNINVTLPNGVAGESLIYLLDSENIMISSGSACNSLADEPSYVLTTIGVPKNDTYRAVRITTPEDFTYENADEVVEKIINFINLLSANKEKKNGK